MILRRILVVGTVLLSGVLSAQEVSLGFSVDAAIDQMDEAESLELVINSKDPGFGDLLKNEGIPSKRYFNNFYRIKVDKNQAQSLYALEGISYVEPTFHRAYLMNDSMISNNRIEDLHKGAAGLKKAYSGNGVLIGFIDTGIDFTHPDFQDTLGNTRIIGIWDQTMDTANTNRVPRWNYGRVFDSTDINAGNTSHDDDILSHGTNVVGIACGNGNAVGMYKGVAPESDIAMVASDFNASNWLQTVADGVEYIFELADTADRPAVVNISAGVYLGSHDGTDLAALRIDSMLKASKGRVVVAANGNAGTQKFHLGYDVDSDTSFTWFELNPSSTLGTPAVYYQLWADTGDFKNVEFAFGANLPSPSFGKKVQSPFYNISSRLTGTRRDTLFADTNVLGIVETVVQDLGDKYMMEVKIDQPDSANYLFSFIATGDGRFDIWSASWLGTSNIYNDSLPADTTLPEIVFYKRPDSLQTMVSSFTCLPSVISVGNYVNRDSYVDVNNTTQTFNVTVGKKADNSSFGPNRRGLQKPDVIASGDYTMTANRLASIPLHIANNQADRIGLGGMHKRNGGTSMAAPVVSGIAALMMEECSDLDFGQIKANLLQNTYSDSLTGSLPNYGYGYGKVDASASMPDLYFSSAITPGGVIQVCEFDEVVISGPQGMASYTWSTGDTTQSIIIDSVGFYSLTVVDTSACLGSTETVEMRKWTNPAKPTITVIDDNTLESSAAFKYLWHLDGFAMATETSQQLNIFVGGHYSVEVADANDCKTHSDSVFSYLNVGEIITENTVVLYPNPSSNGEFNIDCKECTSGQELHIEVYDLNGKVVLVESLSNDRRFNIPFKGMYHYRLYTESKEISRGRLIFN